MNINVSAIVKGQRQEVVFRTSQNDLKVEYMNKAFSTSVTKQFHFALKYKKDLFNHITTDKFTHINVILIAYIIL